MEQREIKFRAWDSEVERMVYSDVGDDEYVWHIDMGGIILLNHQINDDGQHFYPKIEVPFMQYTGLKDKNRKEIYEGDILNGEYQIHFYTGMFVAVPISQFPNHDNSYQIQWIVLTYDAIVSGNIYETPELLSKNS